MAKRKRPPSESSELRQRALEILHEEGAAGDEGPSLNLSAARAFQELEIHKVELEVQNEHLRQSRVELEAALDRYTQLFDFAPIGYATLSGDGTVREMNHVGAGLLFEQRARLVGKRFVLSIAPADRASFNELLSNVLVNVRKETRELELMNVADERLQVRISACSLVAAEPTVLIAFEDITAERRASERLLRADAALREADRRKDEFLAVLSHELRTPLSTLLVYAQLLKKGVLDDAKTQAGLDAIERAARVQARLIDDLLDISRIIAGKLSMNVRPVEMNHVAKAALAAVEKEAEKKQLHITADLAAVPRIWGDTERLQQAVTNLLTNAVKFTRHGGDILLRVSSNAQHVMVEVKDSGAGIDKEALPHLFERFYQVDGTSTRTTGGLGLGLSIARAIVVAHHGGITAWSEGLGKGSKFSIALPVSASPNAAVAPSSHALSQLAESKIRGTRLLVVEDDAGTRESLTEVLSMAGADVRAAEGGAAAMRVLGDFRPDVLVCDIAMPDEDGCALLRRIRARGPRGQRKIPALALTAFASEVDRQRTREAGFETHLVKPVAIEQLLTAVANLLPERPAGMSN